MDMHGTAGPTNWPATLEDIKALIGQMETIRPAYGSLLRLFGPIFFAQEQARASVAARPEKVTTERIASFNRQENTLIDKSDFPIDLESAKRLFEHICTIAGQSDAKEMRPETALMRAVTARDFDPKALFYAVINEDEAFFQSRARAYRTTPESLMLLAYNSIKPSLASCASALKAYLPEEEFWPKPGCPVCGSAPVLSMLSTAGKRYLICGFCWSQWAAPRIRCPFCIETDSRKIHYKVNDQEKEYRIEICDRCRSYWKTVDTRELNRPFYAPLEALVSAHLDLLMEDEQHHARL